MAGINMSHNHWSKVLRDEVAKLLGDDYATWPDGIDQWISDCAKNLSSATVTGPRFENGQALVDIHISPMPSLETFLRGIYDNKRPRKCGTCVHWAGNERTYAADCRLQVVTGKAPFDMACPMPSNYNDRDAEQQYLYMQSQVRG